MLVLVVIFALLAAAGGPRPSPSPGQPVTSPLAMATRASRKRARTLQSKKQAKRTQFKARNTTETDER
jgi:hypothetical protein